MSVRGNCDPKLSLNYLSESLRLKVGGQGGVIPMETTQVNVYSQTHMQQSM